MNTVTGKLMKQWMLIFLSLNFIFVFQTSAKCEFKNEVKKLISLSGPVTVILHELKLLTHPIVKGISVFHPFNEKDFQGKVYPGGIFLSHSVLEEFQNSVVFYDESKELGRLLSSHKKILPVEIKTRNLLPLASINKTLEGLKPFLSDCEKEIQTIVGEASAIQQNIIQNAKKKLSMIFYLGELRNNKRPELVIVNDGIVKLLIEQGKISSYPTDLAYVNWSSRLMREMPKDTLHIGIKDSGRDKTIKIKRSSQEMTLYYPGSLIPGLTQLRAFQYLFKNI